MTNLGETMLIAFAGYGLRIEKTKETKESLTIYVSVPESSEMMNAHGEQMSGMRLSKRLREVMEDMGIKRLTVKAKVRTGDHWTKEKHDAADLEMRKSLFGSQY